MNVANPYLLHNPVNYLNNQKGKKKQKNKKNWSSTKKKN